MAVTEIVQGCGAFRFDWANPLPLSVRRAIPDGATLCVFDSIVTEEAADRDQAIFEGYVTILSTSYVSGWESSWLLQKPSGAGPPETIDTGSVWLDERIDGTFPINGVTFDDFATPHINSTVGGIYGPAAGPGTAARPDKEVRTYMDDLAVYMTEYEAEKYSWKMSPGLKFSFGPIDDLFTQFDVVISDMDTLEYGGAFRNIPAVFEVSRSVEAIATEVVAYGDRNATSGTTPTETVSTAAPFTAPDGSTLVMRSNVDGGGGRTQLELIASGAAASSSVHTNITVTLNGDPWEPHIHPGDRVYVHSAKEDVTDSTNTITHFGTIHPQTAWVKSVTRNRRKDQSVMIRTQTGAFIDVTPYVQASTIPASVELMTVWNPPYLETASYGDRLGDNLAIAQRLARSSN